MTVTEGGLADTHLFVQFFHTHEVQRLDSTKKGGGGGGEERRRKKKRKRKIAMTPNLMDDPPVFVLQNKILVVNVIYCKPRCSNLQHEHYQVKPHQTL